MMYKKNIVWAILVIVEFGMAWESSAASPEANLEGGNSGFKAYSNVEKSPDYLHVDSGKPERKVRPKSVDSLPFGNGWRKQLYKDVGQKIRAAEVSGRKAGESAIYTVIGEFVEDRNGGRNGGNREVPEWKAEYDTPKVEIMSVPKYVYADATAAVPVKFKIKQLGKSVSVNDLKVQFYIGKKLRFTYDGQETFAKGNGLGDVGNGDSDVYTVWVPMSEKTFRGVSVYGATTESAFFQVKLIASSKAEGVSVTILSAKTDSACPRVFGDRTVEIIELGEAPTHGVGEQWAANKSSTRQVKTVHRNANRQADQVWNKVTGDGMFWGKQQPFKYKRGSELDKWNALAYKKFDHVSFIGKKEDSRILARCRLFSNGPKANGRAYRMRGKVTGQMVGVYFGISYGHVNVSVLDDGAGMDLEKDSRGGNVKCFEGATVTASVSHADNSGAILGMKLLKSALSIGGTLATGGWSKSLTLGAKALGLAFDLKTGVKDSSSQVVVQGYVSQQGPTQKKPTIVDKWPGEVVQNSEGKNTQNHDLNRTGVTFTVGDTWIFFVNANVAVVSTSANWFDVDDTSYGEFKLPKGKTFSSKDNIKVYTTPWE